MELTNTRVPASRILAANDKPVNPEGSFVLYWMIANRRSGWNFSLERAVDLAKHLGKPLLILEALRADYQWNSDRIHAFVIQGMRDNQKAFAKKNVTYYPYLEKKPGDGRGLLSALAKKASVIVTDDFPCFFLPRMVKAVAARSKVLVEAIDSNGMFPMRSTDRVFKRAHDFRRFLQKNLMPHLLEPPQEDPLKGIRLSKAQPVPEKILKRWPMAEPGEVASDLSKLAGFSIDHSVTPGIVAGGQVAAGKTLENYVTTKLKLYCTDRNQPEQNATSTLSPSLHFGHISAHQVFDHVVRYAKWSPKKVAPKATGSALGWWGAGEEAESFLDQVITWREVGYNMCALTDDYDRFDSLPAWAQLTMKEHEKDRREYLYSADEFEFAKTHDPLWNAAQWQLVTTGVMHNYLRMLWGKKIYQWSKSGRHALETMIHLNNKYALDGRNPNSYSGIFWVLGRYDRAWGPERPVFGKIRYMTSENTARKVRVKNYVKQFSPTAQKELF